MHLRITEEMTETRDEALRRLSLLWLKQTVPADEVVLIQWLRNGLTREAIEVLGVEVAWRLVDPSGTLPGWTLLPGTTLHWFKRVEEIALSLLPLAEREETHHA